MTRLHALLLILHAYIGWRLWPSLPPIAAGALVAWLVASVLLVPLGFGRRRAHRAHGDRLAWAGLLAMGSFSSLLVLTVLRDVALVVVRALGRVAPSLAWPAADAWTAAAVPLLALAFTLVGLYNARRRARVRDVDVPIDGLPHALHGFTIAQVSDLHVGPTIRRRYVEAVVDAVNALDADVIALTGDLVDGQVGELAAHTAPLRRLTARHGAFAVTGNHEYYSGVTAWVAELRRLGLNVLMNEHVIIQHGGAPLLLAGVTDFGAHHFHASHRSDPKGALAGAPSHARVRVLLAHQPASAAAARDAGFDLQLSGHTHGGQFFPWNHFVRFWQPFTAGLHRLGTLWVYVSRGTGYWGPPKRLGAPSEITRLRLVPA
jgi:predicted MPP superfamily phosphohydrolase